MNPVAPVTKTRMSTILIRARLPVSQELGIDIDDECGEQDQPANENLEETVDLYVIKITILARNARIERQPGTVPAIVSGPVCLISDCYAFARVCRRP